MSTQSESSNTPLEKQSVTNMNGETFAFNADINQLLSIIINTFYSNKDVFLRELVSNSSDAIDKIRHESLTDQSLLDKDNEFRIRLIPNKDNNTLTIEDTGIGMTKQELITNLGTIAKSGTKAFMESLQAGADVNMIGQFGVGFYSAYLIADKVTVISTHATEDGTFFWDSQAGGSFTVGEWTEDTLSRGTRIVLHLKEDQHEFLEESRLKELIKKHSQFIEYPIYLQCSKTREVDAPVETSTESVEETSTTEQESENNASDSKEEDSTDNNDETENNDEADTTNDNSVEVEDVSDDENTANTEKSESSTKKVTETYLDWDHLNSQKPLWTRTASEVTNEEYSSFYKSLTNDWEEPSCQKHFSVEGQLEFKGILFVPKRAPHTMFEQSKNVCEIKLYVRRVFITDTYKELMPEYLSFVKGVIDSQDLPLNISREMLQQNKIMGVIRKNLVKKCVELFTELSEDEEKFKEFYGNFSKNLKLGVYEDTANRNKLSKLLRFYSSNSVDKMISLETYVERMKEGQTTIYYIAGESVEAVHSSPCLEMLRANNIEVLYFTDPIDEYMTQQFKEYDDKKFVCITKENLDFHQTDEEKETFKKTQEDLEKVCTHIKETLDTKIEKVIVSQRLSDSPCTLVTGEHGWSANMERILKAQALRDTSMDNMMQAKKTMEINPNSKIIRKITELFNADPTDKTTKDLIWLMYESSVLASGFTLDNPARFTSRINRLIELGLNIAEDEEPEEELPPVPESSSKGDGEDEEDESTMEEVD